MTNKAESYWALSARYLQLANRLYGFYGFRGHQRAIAADVRMYRQDRICDRCFRENKDNTLFELDALISKLNQYRDAIANNDEASLVALLEAGKKRKEEVDG